MWNEIYFIFRVILKMFEAMPKNFRQIPVVDIAF